MEPYPALDGRPDFNRSNWERRAQWPLDWQDKVFMGRAIDALGKAMFGNEWTGRDPEGSDLSSLPKTWAEAPGHLKAEAAQITPRTREAARAAITHQQGTVKRIGYRTGDVIPELTADEWTQLVERREEYRRRTKASWDRWNKVLEVIASALRGERGQSLQTYGRDGARFIPHESDGWNIDQMSEPFKTLKLRIAVSWDRAELCWVFFDAEDLVRLVTAVTPKEMSREPARSLGTSAIEPPQTRPRKRTEKQEAMIAFLLAEHAGKRPNKSDGVIAEDAMVWVTANKDRQHKYVLGDIDHNWVWKFWDSTCWRDFQQHTAGVVAKTLAT